MEEGTKKSESKMAVLSYVAVFLLGALLAVNVFFVYTTLSMNKEMQKLKADDMTLAQAINQIGGQITQLTGGQLQPPTISTKDDSVLPDDTTVDDQ